MNRRVCNLLGILLSSAITLAPHVGRAAPYAPLDCKKAATPAEKAVCGNYGLGQDEARLATLFSVLTSSSPWDREPILPTRNANGFPSATHAAAMRVVLCACIRRASMNSRRHLMLWRARTVLTKARGRVDGSHAASSV